LRSSQGCETQGHEAIQYALEQPVIVLFKKDGQWFAKQGKRISSTKVEVTTMPVTPEQAILIKTKFGGVYESL
jgi:hypothetical protein